MNTAEISRRAFVQRLCLFSAAGTVLASCGGGAEAPAETAEAEAFTCTDTSGLTDAEGAMRGTLEYVDASPVEGKMCDNCILYVAPVEGARCGTCQTLKGPVHPKGYCTIWAAQTA